MDDDTHAAVFGLQWLIGSLQWGQDTDLDTLFHRQSLADAGTPHLAPAVA